MRNARYTSSRRSSSSADSGSSALALLSITSLDGIGQGAGDDRPVGHADQPGDVLWRGDAKAGHQRRRGGATGPLQERPQLRREIAARTSGADERHAIDEPASPRAYGLNPAVV